MEDLYADRLDEQAEILAYHYARSEHQDKAVTYALLAGDHAGRLYARAEATTHYAQALSLARELPESPEAQRLQIDATLKLAAVGASREDMERDQAHLAQAYALAKALVDEPRLAQILYWQGRLAYVRGDMQTAIPHAEQSLALADGLAMRRSPPRRSISWDVSTRCSGSVSGEVNCWREAPRRCTILGTVPKKRRRRDSPAWLLGSWACLRRPCRMRTEVLKSHGTCTIHLPRRPRSTIGAWCMTSRGPGSRR